MKEGDSLEKDAYKASVEISGQKLSVEELVARISNGAEWIVSELAQYARIDEFGRAAHVTRVAHQIAVALFESNVEQLLSDNRDGSHAAGVSTPNTGVTGKERERK